jgi:hypothetical protein
MSKRSLVSIVMLIVIGLMSLPASRAQITIQNASKKISTYRDDPFLAESNITKIADARIGRDQNGQPNLSGDRVSMIAEDFIYRFDNNGETVTRFAWNPWPKDGRPNDKGNFTFPDEARFPLHQVERDADGKIVLRDGLQVWTPRDLRLGITTAFSAANAARDAAEFWSGRELPWGVNNLLEMEPHTYLDFNANYSPSARQIFCGVVAYRLPGQTQIKMFETATSAELVAHECGHALLDVLKPNIDHTDLGFRTWGESFGDQTAMWSSLRDPQKMRNLLTETSGNLNSSNSVTRLCEAYGALVGGTGLRDAFNDKKVSNTEDEVHDRSEVFTGAVYKVFTQIYDDLKKKQAADDLKALEQAADMMGTFLVLSMDFTPENTMTLEDVGKAYLKVDKEIYGGRYGTMFANEFIKREIFDENSVSEWMAHESAVPEMLLPKHVSDRKIDSVVQANLDNLGIGQDFGLRLQGFTTDSRSGNTIVRVQLTDGRGTDAAPFDNHGVLIFRADRSLADFCSPFPSEDSLHMRAQSNVVGRTVVTRAKQMGLDQLGGRLSLARRADGSLTAETRVIRGGRMNCWVEAFSIEHPEGQRREVITPTVPIRLRGLQASGVQILTADDLK